MMAYHSEKNWLPRWWKI